MASGDQDNHDPGHSRDGKGRRPLPPPAFPPGTRRLNVGRHPGPSASELGGAFISPDDPIPVRPGFPDAAFISPDEPIERVARLREDDAFISPDEPIPYRSPRSPSARRPERLAVEDRGVVTGMGDDAHVAPDDLALSGDPHVMELVENVTKLAEALRRRGEAALRTTPEMSRFEATVRAYCVGYLTGRRAEDEEG